mgnify:CR=1 FL=1
MGRLAVVLFNLGGPDGPQAVEPFLFNLFNDPAIIALPRPLRYVLAKLIARRRAPHARAIYARLGGASPLLANTRAQADALERALAGAGEEARVFLAMRYWRPFADEAAAAVRAWDPDGVVLLPLYPQYSATTTGSSLADWARTARQAGIAAPMRAICCYPSEAGFIAALADLTRAGLARAAAAAPGSRPRLLLSAHGLPRHAVAKGDPYQGQIETSAASLVAALARPDLESVICYQSRVGPLKWIGPDTADEIARAGREGAAVVLAPIAFVSEHSETLVELDITLHELAARCGVAHYERVPAVATHPAFIAGLARLVRAASGRGAGIASGTDARLCPASRALCPLRAAGRC